jgi:hypothetical protein
MDKKTYILNHFYSLYKLPNQVKEDLNKVAPGKICWPNKLDEFLERKKPFDLDAKEVDWLEQKVPLPFCDGGEIIILKKGKAVLNFDIIAAGFMLLSGWQEVMQKTVGSRVSTKDTWQYRYKCVRKPIVNYYFDILKTALEKAWEIEIPLQKTRPAVFLSHSVQHVNSGWKSSIKDELGTFNIGNATYLLGKRMFGKDIWRTVDQIMDLEEEYDVRSTYFFMARNGKGYADYDIEKEPYHSWIKAVQGRGSEAGILASNGSHNSAHKLGSDIKTYKYKVYANRFQDCRYKVSQSARALEKNKIVYDNSLGLYDEVGFRNGYCHPFLGWNFKEERPNKFVSVPLNILDSAMAKRKYLSIDAKDVVNVFNHIADQVVPFNGLVSLNWSNTNFSEFGNADWRRSYERIIKSSIEKRFGFKTGYSLVNEVKENGLIPVN